MSTARFDRRARLLDKSDFSALFERAERSADRYFAVLARPNGLGHPRLGLAISKRSAKSAVVRNGIKRVIRESFRVRQQLLGSNDFVVLGRPGIAGTANQAYFESLEGHWRRLVKRCAWS